MNDKPALSIWQEKLDYLKSELAKANDPGIIFNLKKGIADAEEHIRLFSQSNRKVERALGWDDIDLKYLNKYLIRFPADHFGEAIFGHQ